MVKSSKIMVLGVFSHIFDVLKLTFWPACRGDFWHLRAVLSAPPRQARPCPASQAGPASWAGQASQVSLAGQAGQAGNAGQAGRASRAGPAGWPARLAQPTGWPSRLAGRPMEILAMPFFLTLAMDGYH